MNYKAEKLGLILSHVLREAVVEYIAEVDSTEKQPDTEKTESSSTS